MLVWKRGGDFISGFSQWRVVRTLALVVHPDPFAWSGAWDAYPAPLSSIPDPWRRIKMQMAVGGVKGQRRNSCFPPGGPHCLPTETPDTVMCLWVALSEDRGQAFYIKGALNIFYFLKELCL